MTHYIYWADQRLNHFSTLYSAWRGLNASALYWGQFDDGGGEGGVWIRPNLMLLTPLCPCPCARVRPHACPAPHRPVLFGVPVFPGADRCAVPGDGGLPLQWPWPLHALRGDGRWAHSSADASEFGLRWSRSICKFREMKRNFMQHFQTLCYSTHEYKGQKKNHYKPHTHSYHLEYTAVLWNSWLRISCHSQHVRT